MIARHSASNRGDVERDVVVDEEDRARAARARVGDVVDHARDREAVEVAARASR